MIKNILFLVFSFFIFTVPTAAELSPQDEVKARYQKRYEKMEQFLQEFLRDIDNNNLFSAEQKELEKQQLREMYTLERSMEKAKEEMILRHIEQEDALKKKLGGGYVDLEKLKEAKAKEKNAPPIDTRYMQNPSRKAIQNNLSDITTPKKTSSTDIINLGKPMTFGGSSTIDNKAPSKRKKNKTKNESNTGITIRYE